MRLPWGERPEARAAVALVYTALVLTAFEYGALPVRVQARLDAAAGSGSSPISLAAGLAWAAACVVGYTLIPVALARLERRRLGDLGWLGRRALRHLPVYLALFLPMIPLVLLAARRPEFLATYPFVPSAADSLGTLLLWETAYVAQFFALESFFRGYLLFTLEGALGWLAVPAMAVPYTMIHFHKPPLEAFGALGAGLVLGFLALRYRSWYGGAVLHALVALSMDLLAVKRAHGVL